MRKQIQRRITAQPCEIQTICEVHRRMYRIIMARDPNDQLIPLLHTAFDMAKRMNAKLKQYNEHYDDGWYEKHKYDGGAIDK